MAQIGTGKRPGVMDALRAARGGLIGIGLLSGFLNLLILGGALYVMVMFDTVFISRSAGSLLGMSLLSLVAIGFYAFFRIVRSRLLIDLAGAIHLDVSGRMPAAIHYVAMHGGGAGDGLEPVHDLNDVRSFLSGPGPAALLDLPWTLLALIFLFFAHVWLGVLAIVALLIMGGLCYLMERSVDRQAEMVNETRATGRLIAETHRRHADSVRALGITRSLGERWMGFDRELLDLQHDQDQRRATLSEVAGALRLVIISAAFTVGMALAFADQASIGVTVASGLLLYQILAPVDRAIAAWPDFGAARQAWHRLDQLLPLLEQTNVTTILPPPVASLDVAQLVVAPPGRNQPLVYNVSLKLAAGEVLGIVGPSGAGKTVLLKGLAGVWPPSQGAVRLDGAMFDQWDIDDISRQIGYLPQNIELLQGSVAQNIARFDPDATSEEVIEAAQRAGVHEMILRLPEGYETQVGRDGLLMPPGRRQRIGLARALFRDPFILLLDDPSSHTDGEGEAALIEAIAGIKARKRVALIVAYSHSLLAHVDHIMAMQGGTVAAYGSRDQLLPRLIGPNPATHEAPQV